MIITPGHYSGKPRLEDSLGKILLFADFGNRELLDVNNEHLLFFSRFNPQRSSEKVLFNAVFQYLDLIFSNGRGINKLLPSSA